MDYNPPGSLSIGFSRQNTGASCHFFLKIFPTQGLNLHLLYGFFTAKGGFLSAESLRKPTTVFASFFCIQYATYFIHFNTGKCGVESRNGLSSSRWYRKKKFSHSYMARNNKSTLCAFTFSSAKWKYSWLFTSYCED